MLHKAGYVNIIDLILRGECPVDVRLNVYLNKFKYDA